MKTISSKNFQSKALITVIVPTYNRRQLLQYTLNSLVKQNFPVSKFEVIVVDDGSFDGSWEVVKEYHDRLNLKYYYQEDQGYRVATARNVGIENASGEIIVFIDSGVLLGSDCLRAHYDLHANSTVPVAGVGYVFGFDQDNAQALELLKLIDYETPEVTIRHFLHHKQYVDIRETEYIKYNDRIEDLPAPWVFFWTCNVSVTLERLRTVGKFDENFNLRWGTEDQDLGLRLFKAGVTILLNRKATSIHYPHYKNREKNLQDDLHNRLYLHKKHKLFETSLYTRYEDMELNEKIQLYKSKLTREFEPKRR